MEKQQFNVLIVNINTDEIEPYDILPFLRCCYDETVENNQSNPDYWKIPVTLEDWIDFVDKWCKYQYWSRCEYEFLIQDWPCQKFTKKIDVYKQIKMNLELIARLLYNEYKK